ncbi:MAG: C13 family peptidase [Xanthobacteraceae bacterium]
MRSVLKLASRAAIWRTTPDPQPVGLPSLLIWIVVLAALRIALQFVAAGPGGGFNPYGLNAIVAWLALEAAVAALFMPAAARTTALSAMFALLVVAELAAYGAKIGVTLLPAAPVSNAVLSAASFAIFAAVSVWWVGAIAAVLRSCASLRWLPALGRVAALWVALLAVTVIVPHAPVFVGRDFDIRSSNGWEALHAKIAAPAANTGKAQGDAARFGQAQRALLQAEIAALAPPANGATNVYAIGIAGWAGQDVFLKELDGGLAVLGDVLPIKGHTLRLVNQGDTIETVPLATPRNFTAAVHAAGEAMNKNEDILLVLMTSHGEPNGFGLRLPNEAIAELTPNDLAATLNNEGIKNRVVIVSACFAGVFVPPLANDNTIVLTAADAKNTSFGCAPERDWTYFGDAFFRQSLRPGRDLQRAFDNARLLIHGWELMDHATPSNPQGHFGPALVAKLAPFFAASTASGK